MNRFKRDITGGIKQMLLATVLALTATLSFAGALTDAGENKVLDALMRSQAIGTPATWYMGLDTGSCTEAGGGTEVTGGSYARVAITAGLTQWAGSQSAGSTAASSGTSGTTSNNAVISFATPTVAWGTVVSMRLWDAITGGTAWICTALSLNKVINIGDTVSFPAGAFTFQIDN